MTASPVSVTRIPELIERPDTEENKALKVGKSL